MSPLLSTTLVLLRLLGPSKQPFISMLLICTSPDLLFGRPWINNCALHVHQCLKAAWKGNNACECFWTPVIERWSLLLRGSFLWWTNGIWRNCSNLTSKCASTRMVELRRTEPKSYGKDSISTNLLWASNRSNLMRKRDLFKRRSLYKNQVH